MDQSTQQLIDKFKHNPAMAQALLQSLDGQRLMQMLTAQDGGAALNRAAQSAAAGNTKELAADALRPYEKSGGNGRHEPHQRQREKVNDLGGASR